MSEQKRVLLVDDESQILRVLRHVLAGPEYSVRTAADGSAALEVFSKWTPDLVITDLNMPSMSGMELCAAIRQTSQVPIIVLSVRNDEETIVEALDAGADDYIVKPFSSGELLARIRSALRRQPKREANIIDIGEFYVDIEAHIARVRGTEVRLTPKEFELLAFLTANHERVLTHGVILRGVWGSYYVEQPEGLRVLVNSWRKKIEPDPAHPIYLVTEPWIGYRFLPQPI